MHSKQTIFSWVLTCLMVMSVVAPDTFGDVSDSYHPPREWHGDVKGESSGNPVLVADEPMWEFVQLEGKDPSSAEAVKPMIWGGSQWIGAREFGGQPSVSIRRKTVTLASRGSWAGSGNTKGLKTAAFAFLAPEAGTYAFTGSAQAEVWQGKGPVELVMYHFVPGESLTFIEALELKNGSEPEQIEGWSVTLEQGEGLILAALVERNYTAANVHLRGFTVSSSPNAEASP